MNEMAADLEASCLVRPMLKDHVHAMHRHIMTNYIDQLCLSHPCWWAMILPMQHAPPQCDAPPVACAATAAVSLAIAS